MTSSGTTPIYLDHNATTPLDDDVLAAMLPFLREEFGNPLGIEDCNGRPSWKR